MYNWLKLKMKGILRDESKEITPYWNFWANLIPSLKAANPDVVIWQESAEKSIFMRNYNNSNSYSANASEEGNMTDLFFSSSFPFFSPRFQFEYAKDAESVDNVKERRRGK